MALGPRHSAHELQPNGPFTLQLLRCHLSLDAVDGVSPTLDIHNFADQRTLKLSRNLSWPSELVCLVMRVEEGFQPNPIHLPHPYTDDLVLPSLFKRIFPQHLKSEIQSELVRWGNEIRGPIQAIGALCDPPSSHPSLRQYNEWGRRIDELSTSPGWRALKAITFKEGLISIAYERNKYAEWARVYSFAKIVIYNADARTILCPFSMTDGCARVLELFGTEEMKRDILPHLLSRDPSEGFTAGQWMTERPGGSDLSHTETTAKLVRENVSAESFGSQEWCLDGFKWFSSATDGNLSVVLARTGPISLGSRSLSLFIVPLRLPLIPSPPRSTLGINTDVLPSLYPNATRSNNIYLHRLKNKIGTHPVPTAELSLSGAKGYLIGSRNEGVKTISPVLNITRLHSAILSVSCLSRSLQIARSYASVRTISSGAGGDTLLRDLPLHTYTLAKVSVLYRALTHLTFGVVCLLGRSENENATVEESVMLRLLTPVAKGFVASYAVGGMEECMIALGGQGYMEETGIGRMIRDASVEKIWEGTANVLALDVIKACAGGRAMNAFSVWGMKIVSQVPSGVAGEIAAELWILKSALGTLQNTLDESRTRLPPSNVAYRPIFFLLGQVASGLFLLEHACWAVREGEETAGADLEGFRRWVRDGPVDGGSGGGAGGGMKVVQVEVLRCLKEWEGIERGDKALLYGNGGGGVRSGARL